MANGKKIRNRCRPYSSAIPPRGVSPRCQQRPDLMQPALSSVRRVFDDLRDNKIVRLVPFFMKTNEQIAPLTLYEILEALPSLTVADLEKLRREVTRAFARRVKLEDPN